MRRVAGFALSMASFFLVVVAILLDSGTLFYMATAMLATIAAARLQAWLSVRGLTFDRVAPETVKVGELVTVQITVLSERKVRRPLITIYDNLPSRLVLAERSLSLPIAPAYDLPIRTQYQFRALKRGKYRWSGLTVEGTDALGLVTMRKQYNTAPAEMTVLPAPIPVTVELPTATGWGISEAESGKSRGAGLEPRGIREYSFGDSLRYVHWRSSARAGRLLVKEFEAGSLASTAFVLQRTKGSEIGVGAETSLEIMCGHTAYLSDMFLRQGARVELPQLEVGPIRNNPTERLNEIYELLAAVQADQDSSLGDELLRYRGDMPPGSIVFASIAVVDDSLVEAIHAYKNRGIAVAVLVYDAKLFPVAKKAQPFVSAAEPAYLERLQGAGAEVIMMPVTGSSHAGVTS